MYFLLILNYVLICQDNNIKVAVTLTRLCSTFVYLNNLMKLMQMQIHSTIYFNLFIDIPTSSNTAVRKTLPGLGQKLSP